MGRYTKTIPNMGGRTVEVLNTERMIKDGGWVVGGFFCFIFLWPFYSVPTGSRGVVTQFGKIVGIENEGLAVLPPWQNLTLFSIRAEEANIENASGATSDTQAVSV